jgi:hypothetical protein
MPQDKKPRRFASDFMNCVYFDLLFMTNIFKKDLSYIKALALIVVEILFFFLKKEKIATDSRK